MFDWETNGYKSDYESIAAFIEQEGVLEWVQGRGQLEDLCGCLGEEV